MIKIEWSIKDIEIYLNTKYGYELKREEIWHSRNTYEWWALDRDGNKAGKAIEIFKSDYRKMILSKMITD